MSEPNEREAFEKFWDYERARVTPDRHSTKDACYAAWQHQQKRIDEIKKREMAFFKYSAEREAFEIWWPQQAIFTSDHNAALSAWQHQQEIITNLNGKLQQIVEDNVQLQAQLTEIQGGYLRTQESTARISESYINSQAKCTLLEKQNTIAVNALEDIGNTNWHFSMSRKLATEALAEINRLQEGE